MIKTPLCFGYIGDYTTQLCGDYFINHQQGSLLNNQYITESVSGTLFFFFFRGKTWTQFQSVPSPGHRLWIEQDHAAQVVGPQFVSWTRIRSAIGPSNGRVPGVI